MKHKHKHKHSSQNQKNTGFLISKALVLDIKNHESVQVYLIGKLEGPID